MKKLLFASLLWAISFLLTAQNSNTRLWRISGNGLTKPSYLYGSMHVDDERAFNFSDSVFYALASCEVFANEVSADSVLKFLYQKFDDSFQERLSENYFGDDDEALDEISQSTGLDKASLKKMSPVVLRQLIPGFSGKRKRRPAILDNYLYNIARGEGKTCIGIERINDQIAIFNNFPEQIKKDYTAQTIGKKRNQDGDQLIELYSKADMNGIEKLMKGMPPELFEAMFTLRNIGMAHSIDSISRKRSAFYTIGFGHFPGSEGLINLLEKKGYTVTPVTEEFTGKAEKFSFRNKEIPWVAFTDPLAGYSIEMPGQSYTSPNFPSGIHHGLYLDMGTNSFYMAMATASNVFTKVTNVDSLTYAFAANAWKLNSKDLTINHVYIEGIDFRQVQNVKMGEFKVSFRIAVHEGTLYVLVGLSTDEKNSKDINRFFDSFRRTEKVSADWLTFTSPKGGYSVDFPGNPKENIMQDPSDENTLVGMISGIDNTTGNEFLVQYIDSRSNFYPNDSVVLALVMNNTTDNSVEGTIESEFTTIKGYPALQYSFEMQTGQLLSVLAIVRGSRIYNIIASRQAGLPDDPMLNHFFASFRLNENTFTQWTEYTSTDGLFSVLAPALPTKAEEEYFSDKFTSSSTYSSFDEYTGDKIAVRRQVFSPYYQAEPDSAFFATFYTDYLNDDDSIVSLSVSKNHPYDCNIYAVSTTSHLISRSRLVLSGRSLISVVAMAPAQDTATHPANRVCASLKVTDNTASGDIRLNKTAMLMADLTSGDTTRMYAARSALSFYTFTTDELPAAYELLRNSYSDDTLHYGSVRLNLLASFDKSADSVYKQKLRNSFAAFCPNNYSKVPGLATLVKGFDTTYRDFVFEQLLLIPDNQVYKYRVFTLLYDSLEYAVPAFPAFFGMIADTLNRDDVVNITSAMLSDKLIDPAALMEYKPLVMKVMELLLKPDTDPYESDFLSPKLFYIAGFLKDKSINDFLLKNRNARNKYIEYNILKAMIMNKMEFKAKNMEHIASDLDLRRSLYDFLSENNSISLMPAEYRTQDAIAASDLYWRLNEDDYEIDDIFVVGSKEIEYKGSMQKFYLCRVTTSWDGEESVEYNVAGPYATDGSISSLTNEELTGGYYSADEKLSIEQHFEAIEKLVKEWGTN